MTGEADHRAAALGAVSTGTQVASARRLRSRLEHTAAPGRDRFTVAAGFRVAAVATEVVFWLATAGLLAGFAAPTPHVAGWRAGAVMGGALVARALAGYGARWCADAGAQAVSSTLAQRLVQDALPRTGRGVGADPAALAHAVLELSDQVGDYHRLAHPARLACAPAALGVLAVVAVVHWPVALLLAATTPLIVLNVHLAGHATRAAATGQLHQVQALSAQLLDRFRGLRTLAMLGAAPREAAAVRSAAAGLNRATAAVLSRAFISAAVLDTAVTFAIALTALYTGLRLLGYLPAGALPAVSLRTALGVLLLAPVYFAPLRALSSGYHERETALAALDSIDGHLAQTAPDNPGAAAPGAVPSGAPAIQMENLTVCYPGARHAVLEAVTARLAPGRIAALQAPSGVGKTTLLATIAGLITPSAGTIALGCGPTHDQPRPSGLTWVGQTTVLLAGSLADNIRLGNPAASRRDVHEAALRAGLGPLLARLPQGLDSPISEGGWGISAGEAQRVALARALLRDAPLWLLDEPTAHLDGATEAQLCQTLSLACQGRTVLIATHSAAVAALADEMWTLIQHDGAGAQLAISPGMR